MAIITIGRGTKSGGRDLAECLARRLEYPLLGREVVQNAAAQLGVPAEDVGGRMEEKPGRFGRDPLITKLYIAAVQTAIVEQVEDGNLVYDGLAGGLLLKELAGVLSIRLIAPLEFRVQALMQGHGMDEASAEAYIEDVDNARRAWVRAMYGEDVDDASLYDMVLNFGSFSVGEACDVVTATVAQPEFESTPESRKALVDFRTGCQVRLALLEDLGTQTLDLDATSRAGVVVVSGQAPMLATGEVGNRITELARSVPGVEEVHLDIEWFDPYP
jgi:cytidylate kinase